MTRIEQCTQAHFKSLLHAVGACGSTEAIARSIDAEQADGRDVVRRPREGVGDVHGDEQVTCWTTWKLGLLCVSTQNGIGLFVPKMVE